MKFINKIIIFIASICLLGCAAILFCALNPTATEAVSDTLYGENGLLAGRGADTEETAESDTAESAEADGGETTESGLMEDLSDYINPNPTSPLRYTAEETESAQETIASSIDGEKVLQTMEEYYADCLAQCKSLGTGDVHFTNIVPKSLYASIERAYGTDAYKSGYVTELLSDLGAKDFAIQLELETVGDDYYRIYHNVVVE